MRTIKIRLTWITCAVALFGGVDPAWSSDDTQQDPWNMSPTAAPFVTPESYFSVGAGYLSGDRQNLGMFDSQNHSHGTLLLDANILKRDNATGTWTQAIGRNMGLEDNREFTLGLERQGLWGMRADYVEIPYRAPYTANTKNSGLGTTNPIISSTATTGDGFTQHIGTDRDRFTLNTFRTWNKNIKFNLNFRNETKEGTRMWGERRSTTNDFILEPVDWTMRQVEPTLGFVGKDLQLQGGYSGSWFLNENNLVDSLLKGASAATLANHTYLTLPMDNEAHQFFLSGGYQITPETRSTFKLSYSRALQNEHLPTSDITGLSSASAPSSLQGRVDNTLLMFGLTTQPLPELSITTKLRYDDDRDKTPAWLVTNITTAPATQVHNTPVSVKTTSALLEGTYRLPFQASVTGGVERKEQKRSIPFGNDLDKNGLDDERFVPWRSELDETTYRMQLRRTMSETVNGSLGFEHSNRTGSDFVVSNKIMSNTPSAGDIQGKISPFFIADRERNKLRYAMDWRPMDRLGFQFNVENAMDHYGPDQVRYGLQKGNTQLYSMDVDYAPMDKWLLTAWYAYDINKLWQDSGRWSTAGAHEADKGSILKDSGNSFGIGARNQWSDQLKIGSNFQWTRAKSTFDDTVSVDSTSTAPAYPSDATGKITSLSEIVSPMTRFNAFMEFKGWGPGTLRGDYTHEHWSSNDWTWKFSDGTPYTYGTTTDGTQISTKDSQSSDFFVVRYTTKFQ
ncbi:MAG: MtrB/PioB family decaheme-associated outer membrane protein [Magnetococcales bacterium]|nr:MtrB/PioB family decaheme-associated outer membrane protein [Magnetococcales bacterium]